MEKNADAYEPDLAMSYNSWKSFRAGRQSVKKGSGDSVSVPVFALEREYNMGLQKITEKYLYNEEEYDGGNSKTARWQHV